VLAIIVSVLLFLLSYNLLFWGTIFPNTFIAGVNVGGMKPEAATLFLSENIHPPEKIMLTYEGGSFELPSSDVALSYDFDLSVRRAYETTRTGNILFDLSKRMGFLFSQENLGLSLKINEEDLGKFISIVAGQISIDPIFPSAKVVDGKVVVNKGKAGNEIDTKLLRANIGESLSLAKSEEIIIPLMSVDPTLSDDEALKFEERANKLLGKTIQITFEFETFKLLDSDLVNLLDPRDGLRGQVLDIQIFDIAQKINRAPQDPKFSFADGKVSEFLPAKDGVELNPDLFKQKLEESIVSLSESEEKTLTYEVPVSKTPPQTTTDKVNDLGIQELIGRGTSRFRGSIPSRIHNVDLAANRLNGILIKPGETFSFNESLGDVSKFTGYQEAYIIRDGKTILGDGGGVCQVSTTLFRAALNAGLPITERQAHAYRVGYYEQDSPPGLDATVYGPSPDLKIKNDTPAHILIQAKADTKNLSLVFELYGTNDGRVSTVSKPAVTSVTQPGEDLYIDDPTLPVGTVKQTEHKTNGARVVFNYLVQRNGETITQKTFISNFRPWQAVYLRGTKPAI
jgi:vancomycin resistance protein YoaR